MTSTEQPTKEEPTVQLSSSIEQPSASIEQPTIAPTITEVTDFAKTLAENAEKERIKARKKAERRRKKQAKKRNARLLASGIDRLAYIHQEISKEQFNNIEKENMKDPEKNIKLNAVPDEILSGVPKNFNKNYKSTSTNGHSNEEYSHSIQNFPSNPFLLPNNCLFFFQSIFPLFSFYTVNNNPFIQSGNQPSMEALLQNMQQMLGNPPSNIANVNPTIAEMMNEMKSNGNANNPMPNLMKEMMNGLFGGCSVESKQEKELKLKLLENKKKVNEYENYAHHIFCILFAFFLIAVSFDFITISVVDDSYHYSIFITLEVVLFTIFYAYKHWYLNVQFKKEIGSQGQMMRSDGKGMNNMLFRSMIESVVGGIFGKTVVGILLLIMDKMSALMDAFRMLMQMMSDFALIIFFWVIFAAIFHVCFGMA